MTTFKIALTDSKLVNPGSTQVSMTASPGKSQSAPISVIQSSPIYGPAASAAWFSVDDFPLPCQVNFDEMGLASAQLKVSVPPEVELGTYFATLAVGYAQDTSSCPVFSVQVSTCQVPVLKGLSLQEARQTLQDKHLSVGYVAGLVTDDCLVIGQVPPPGVEVSSGTAVNLTVAPAAMAVSEVRLTNCRLTEEGVWRHDLLTGTWSKLDGSPLPPKQGLECPSATSVSLSFKPDDGHYYDLQAASPLIGGDSPPSPTAVGYWRLEHGVLLGDASAPLLELTIQEEFL